jgi:hypothetical protein
MGPGLMARSTSCLRPPPWHYYRSSAFWDLERGRAVYLVPGRAPQTADLFAAGLSALPPDQETADWPTRTGGTSPPPAKLCG